RKRRRCFVSRHLPERIRHAPRAARGIGDVRDGGGRRHEQRGDRDEILKAVEWRRRAQYRVESLYLCEKDILTRRQESFRQHDDVDRAVALAKTLRGG